MKSNTLWKLTILSGTLAVVIGAFGAHGIKPHLTDLQYESFLTGSRYHFFHTIMAALILVIPENLKRSSAKWTPILFLAGILLFSGSIYLLACKDLINFPVSWLGPVTPIGGLLLIAAWISMFFTIKKPS